MEQVASRYPDNPEILSRMSIIQEGDAPRVRMAHLAIVGSHAVNGVSALHTRILKTRLFKDFELFFPGRIHNITNGISPRRWLLQINPDLTGLINSAIGTGWICDLNKLKGLIPYADDPKFQNAWQRVKRKNKEHLFRYILKKTGHSVDINSLFDVQIKRIHEYKRQLLNVLHILTLYNRLKENPSSAGVPRTFIFSGKAAPGYTLAKLIIKLINSVADLVNTDPDVNRQIKVIFLSNYSVTQAEKVIPAADLSEQISTAGMEASGTGNMKFALNGSQIIGTLDGANIEIMEEIGRENMFVFGLTVEELENLKAGGYNPKAYYLNDMELKQAIDMLTGSKLSPGSPGLFDPIRESLLAAGDRYFILADYRSYIRKQEDVSRIFRDTGLWTRRSILNTAGMGYFSSDRAVLEYAKTIWNVAPMEESRPVTGQGIPR